MRDYAADMRAVMDAETGGSYEARVVASHIVEKLRATDPELLTGWLHEQAETLLWQAINDRDRSRRAHARTTAPATAFAADANAHTNGVPTAMGRWLAAPFTVAENVRKPLADMTRNDLLFASQAYHDRANQNRMTGAFLAALAKKVGTGAVRDQFTEDQLSRMWQSIAGPAAA